jgi:hypothetical protein
VSSGQINLTWSPSTDTGDSGLAGYKVYREPETTTPIGITTATNYPDYNRAANTEYCYRVIAYDNAGNPSTYARACARTQSDDPLVGFVPGVGTANGVAVSGGLAFIASDPFGLSVADVTNPAAPLITGASNVPFFGRAVAVSGSRAVVVGQTPQGLEHLWVLDLTITSRPNVVGELAMTNNISAVAYISVVLNSTGTLTLAVITMGTDGISVVDITNPAAPFVRGTYNTPGCASGVALNSTATLAYVADGSGDLQIVNISNPSSPTLAGSLSMVGSQVDIAVAGTTAYLVTQTGQLQVVDVSIPSAPVFKGSALLSGYGSRVAVEGTRAVVLSFDSTVEYLDIFNVSNPASPVRTSTSAVVIGSGHLATGVDLANGLAYVTIGSGELKIYSVGTSTPSQHGTVSDDFLGQAIAVAGHVGVILGKDIPTNTVRLEVLDLADPTTPEVVGKLPMTVPTISPGNGVALNSGGTLAVAVMGTDGIKVVDLTNPAAPFVRGTYNTPGSAFGVALNSTATLAYVADGSGDLQIVNISNPSSPTLAGSLSMVGSQVDIAVAGTTAYLAAQNGTMQVVDVSIPSAPVFKGSALLSGYGCRVAVEGTLAAVLSKDNANDYLDIIDVSNPTSPVRTGSVVIGPVGTAYGVALSNRLAYVAANTQGLQIYDLAAPATPVLSSTLEIVGDALGVTVQGGFAYVADFPATIDIIDLP